MSDTEIEPVVSPEPEQEEPVEDTRLRGTQGRPFMDDESVLRFPSLQVSRDFTSVDEEWDWILEMIDELNGHSRFRPSEDEIHDKFCLSSSSHYLFDKDHITDWMGVRKAVIQERGLWEEGLDLCP
tara:strand:- start:615 stop:992 length:378 start_codon:yes stop_codon:yes gene_type:complete